MKRLYGRWIDRWETKLATRDKNRIVRPFEWGFDWLPGAPEHQHDPREAMRSYTAAQVERSADFFSYRTPTDFRVEANRLTFTSAVETPYPENNRVLGQFFAGRGRRAVVVLPQWNSDVNGHIGLCRLLNRFGITALRMSLAYHDERMPAELERADYHVSSNVGRTISAARQSVVDVRSCLDWLEQQGYERLGILGSSLGSCIAFITAAHDRRLRAGVFNHVSMYFSDVVWTGISTQHIRKSFEGVLTQEELRDYWRPISPATYLDRIAGTELKSLLIWARYDTTFLPDFSRQVLENFRCLKLDHKVVCLPCAHYTTGQFPFNLLDGMAMSRFLHARL
ncbi:MAG: dienelactone hydrolase family protein [Bryobacteraceae bacterium]